MDCLTWSFPKKAVGITRYNPFEEFLPESKGVYTIFDRDGTVQYVGSSNHIQRRMKAHKKSGVLQPGYSVEALIFDKNTEQQIILAYEREQIRKLAPQKNKSSGTPGRSWHVDNTVKLKRFYICNKTLLKSRMTGILEKFLHGDRVAENDYQLIRRFLRIMYYFK